ncbi:glucose 1-dehydrogenase [Bailinhaonella thermotolerans]|uniref:Glucose 1-dehydrogenase n=1 Tax=Bailinhaonella thermotolerans TaxID=1070861 RepID=A0A3A4BAU2_9ACTN|nr:glucose 1-dehydrogenase [Bailinhaonella thermotolerans]RJL31318.1 glucose 1-dehydrogenase [Bailinhaonella thermotolerans]
MGTLDGKAALVTGGSRGIGRAIAERLAREGATVAFTYRSDDAAAKEAAGERIFAIRADQASLAELERAFEEAVRLLGGLDILVNNAAINPVTPLAEVTEETYDHVMAVNAKAAFFAMRHAARVMRDGGRIINISTLNTALPAPGLILYSASKAALEQFSAVASRELGPRGITVNTVSPGATDTDLLRATNPPEALEQTPAWTALGRLGRPADIAAVVAFLAGPDSAWITGQNLRATGGFLL